MAIIGGSFQVFVTTNETGLVVHEAFPHCLEPPKVSFTELCRQGQQTLMRDFPHSCVFKNQMDVLTPESYANVAGTEGIDSAIQAVKSASFATHAPCLQHKKSCKLPEDVDLCLLSSPCTDDSLRGSQKKDDGKTRKATGSSIEPFPRISNINTYTSIE